MGANVFAHLIRPSEVRPAWVLLYVASWLLQWFMVATRYAALYLLLWPIEAIFELGIPVKELALAGGFAPLFISLGTLVFPWGGWWFQQQMGGRRPSAREQAVFEAAMEQLRGAEPKLRGPRRWFVIDSAEPNACAYADALLVSRGLLESPSLAAVLAHELGHLNSSDARLSAALYRMQTPPREPLEFPFRFAAWLISGRAAMAPMRRPWAIYWRRREIAADEYAAKLGQSRALMDYLDTYAMDDLPTPWKAIGESSHPWTEHRIDHLEPH